MARVMHDTTEIYRTEVKYHWVDDNDHITYYGPYEGPTGKGQARRRIKDQYYPDFVIEARVQKLEAVFDLGDGYSRAKLEWVNVDD